MGREVRHPAPEDQPAPLAARAVNTLSPAVTARLVGARRYHLAGTEGVHLQLPPYRNALHATRFYGLGAVDGAGGAGRKFVVALAVTPTIRLALAAARDGVKEGADATPCPYTSKPRPKPSAPTPEVVGPVARDDADDEWSRGDHKDLEGGEWRCGECGNVNRAHQRDKCNMKRCGAPREGWSCGGSSRCTDSTRGARSERRMATSCRGSRLRKRTP